MKEHDMLLFPDMAFSVNMKTSIYNFEKNKCYEYLCLIREVCLPTVPKLWIVSNVGQLLTKLTSTHVK